MAFDKEAYWAQRNAEKAFRKEWYIWRNDSKGLWGASFVNNNSSMFTQKAFMHYLAALDEAQATQAKVQEAGLELHAPLEPLHTDSPDVAQSFKLDLTTVPDSSVHISDLAPSE